MGDESQEVKLAVAVNDISWMKTTLSDVSQGMKALQESFDKSAQAHATKDEVQRIRDDVDKLKARQYWFGGVLVALVTILEYGRQWITGVKP